MFYAVQTVFWDFCSGRKSRKKTQKTSKNTRKITASKPISIKLEGGPKAIYIRPIQFADEAQTVWVKA